MEKIECTKHEIHLTGSTDGQPRIWSNVSKRYLSIPKPDRSGYIRYNIKIDGQTKHFSIHRLVAEYFTNNPSNYPQVDHIDNDKLNNRIANLRWVSLSQNTHNVKGYKGYSWVKRIKKWHSQIRVGDNNRLHLGLFETEEEAREAYLEASKKYFPGILAAANDVKVLDRDEEIFDFLDRDEEIFD